MTVDNRPIYLYNIPKFYLAYTPIGVLSIAIVATARCKG